jgi:lipopolysaccharide export system protein LptA
MERKMKFITGSILTILLATVWPVASHSVHAAPASNASKDPLEISAAGTLEWHRDINKYIAQGDAVAKQGDTVIKATTLEAFYREPAKGGMEIWKIIANGKVEITAPNGKIYGDHAVYNLDNAHAVMTGKSLRMDSDGQSLTAQEHFEYYITENKLIATGSTKITRPTETLQSDTMIAWFKEGAKSRELWRAEAVGDVVITTEEESISGQKGEYRKEDNKAEISGGVVIRRGPNILEGTRAELDLLTNISRIFGGKAQSNNNDNGAASVDMRARGTFYPGSEKKPKQ